MLRFASTFLVLFMASSSFADQDSAELLESIQGKWQRTVERDGKVIRVVKAVGRKQETISYHIGEEVVYAHRVDFSVSVTSQGYVLSYDNKTITAGPDAGKRDNEKGSYLFKVHDDTWYEVHRMMPGETGAPWITTYKRAKKSTDAADH
jgi:hypothetical protein